MELAYQTIKNDCVQTVAKGQTVVRTDVDVTDRGGVGKLLSVAVDALVTSVEAVAGSARVCGRVVYKVLYLDAEGKIGGLDYFAEFDEDVEDEAIVVGATRATAGILDSDCTVSGGVMHLEAVCEVNLVQVVTHQAEVVTAAPCECLQETVGTVTLAPIAESNFEVVEEVESRASIDRVLIFDAKALHTATRQGVDSTTVEGKIYAEVVYRTEGEIRSQALVFDFAEQLDVEGDVDLYVSLKQAKLVLTGEDDNVVLRVEAVLSVKGNRLEHNECTAVLDAFEPDCDMRIACDSFVCRRYEGLVTRSERVSQKVDEDELDLSAGVVAATTSRVNLANVIASDGQITAEGLVVVSVLYRAQEGGLEAGEVELPFSVTFAAPNVNEGCTLTGEAIALGANVGRQGVVECDLLFAVKCYRPYAVRYVTAIEATPASRHDAVMSVYFAPADATVWDIARAVNVSPSRLLEQNPALADFAESGAMRRVVVFRHRDLD